MLRDAGLLTKVDRDALALYCDSYQIYCKALERLTKAEAVIESPNNKHPMQSPDLAIVNKQREGMRQLLTEFGMTPSSRSRVQVMPPEGAGADEWDNF